MMQSAVSANGKSDKEKMPMEKKMSCCGTVCSDCEYYPADCQGCGEIKGKVFWLEYTGESCCDREDSTKTKEENEADHAMQMKNLKEYKE